MAVNLDKAGVLALLPEEAEDAAGLVESAFAHGQEHLFEGWETRSESYRRTLIDQLRKIDWEVVDEAVEIITGRGETVVLEETSIKPMPMRTWDEQQPDRAGEEEIGRQALVDGRAAWLIPAGGSGSRLVKVLQEIYDSLPFRRRYKVADEQMRHFDEACAKGQLPITPVLGKTFYGLFMEQALALGARVNRLPVLMFMLSDTTREASLTSITTHPLYPALEPAIVLFDHGMNPVLDDRGRIIAEDDRGHLAFSGNGNGGLFKAMWNTQFRGRDNIFAWLRGQGVEVVGFSNVDNPVSDIVLPRMTGSHFRLGCQLTFGVVKKVDAYERVGMIVRVEGSRSLDKIEYNVFPPALAAQTNPDDPDRLLFEHGDVNVFLMDLAAMEKVRHLPLCMYRGKEVPTQWGRKKGNKFETFTFHIIQQVPATAVDVKEILREEQFMPTKNSVGRDSPATVIRALCTRNLRWLERQGASLARQTVEGSLEDYTALCRDRLVPAAAGTALEQEVRRYCEKVAAMRGGRLQPDLVELFSRACVIGVMADKAGLNRLKLAADHAYSILQPGEAKAFVEFSPAFALEAEDLAEAYVGEGWVLEEGCQVALTGHPTQVLLGRNFHVGKGGAFILDIKNEYGEVKLSPDRWLTFELEKAGKAEIGDDVTISDGAELEIHVHGCGRVVIPEGTVISGERFVEVQDGEEVVLEG